jgi:hypothetical protein
MKSLRIDEAGQYIKFAMIEDFKDDGASTFYTLYFQSTLMIPHKGILIIELFIGGYFSLTEIKSSFICLICT